MLKKLYKLNIVNEYSISKRVTNFLNPEYACSLLRNYDNVSDIKSINKSKLLEFDNLSSFSSISGDAAGFVNINISNKSKKALFIKNDFKEKDTKFVTKNVYDKLTFLNLIKGSVFQKKFNHKNIINVIVNGITDEPYSVTESYILKNSSDKIIDILSTLNDYFNIQKSVVAFKNTENDNVSEYLSKSGSYTHMDVILLDDLYSLEKEDVLLEKLGYKKNESIVLKPSELLELRHFLKTNCYMCEKYISVVDTITKKIRIVYVKKNIIVSELLNKLKLLSSDYEYMKNGIISGCKIDENKEIITDDFTALYIIKKTNIKPKPCINCGKCISVCPMGVNPKKVMETGILDSRCNNCGLCLLMCPANINLGKSEKR